MKLNIKRTLPAFLLLLPLLFCSCANDSSSSNPAVAPAPTTGGSAGSTDIASKTLTGEEINKILLTNLGANSSAKYVKPSATAPESSVQTYTINTAINAVLYRSSTTIYYYAKGYTDSNKGIPLNSNCNNMFKSCKSLLTIDMTGFDTSNVTNMCSMIDGCDNLRSVDLSKFNTSKVTNMSWMFSGSKNIISLDLSSFDTRNVTDMSGMFCDTEAVEEINISSFDTSNVTTMNRMFNCMYKLRKLNISHFNTSKVTDMSNMFSNMYILENLNISNFDTRNVTDMSYMFAWNKKLASIDCSSFITSKVTNFGAMFAGMDLLTELDLSKFDFSKATILSMQSESDGTWFGMFYYSKKLSKIYVAQNTDLSGIKTSENLFESCYELVGGSGTNYDYIHKDSTYARVDGGTDKPGYFTVKN